MTDEERAAPRAADGASGERSDPRADDPDEDVPLDIAGHEDRTDPAQDPAGALPGPDEGALPGPDDDEQTERADTGTIQKDVESEGTDPDADPGDPLPDDVPSVEEPAGDEEAVQPVQLLVQLARDGDIDPWDIDLVEVTDEFLARLKDSDLRTSARALFYASVLLRMKGDDLMQEDDSASEEPEPWERPPDEHPDNGVDPVQALEAEMERRLDRKRARGQPETLEDLVHELREAERDEWWKEARTYDTSDSPAGFGRGTQTLDYHADDAGRMGGEPTEADVTGTTHEEDIEAVIDEVRAALRDQYEQGRDEVLYAEVADAGPSRVMSYLALLFLAHRGQVSLRQDDLFGDLWIRDNGAVAGAGEVAAD